MLIVKILFALTGVYLFAFIFWKRLREDYLSETILTSAFSIIGLTAVGALGLAHFFPNLWFWGGLFGLIIGLIVVELHYKLRLFETIDALVASGLTLLSVSYAYALIATHKTFYFGWLLLCLLFLAVFTYFDGRYKKFVWYKSGRVGFSGIATLSLFFLARTVIALVLPIMISSKGLLEILSSAVFAFVGMVTLFGLSIGKIK